MRRVLLLVFAVSLLFGSGCSRATPSVAWSGPVTAGRIATPKITEASGLAISRRADGVLWTHNDSGGEPVLFALDIEGRLRGSVRITGVTNRDWEDVASFELDGKSWLLIAETGDNFAQHKECALYVIAEPDPAELNPERELTAPVAWRVPVRYPGGPRDCESVAVDVRTQTVFLISKRTTPPAIYTLPLRAESTPLAEPIGTLTGLTPPEGMQAMLNLPAGRFRNWPVGMDISADGTTAVVLTYGEPYLYPRQPGESWTKAFTRPPVRLAPHNLAQAEGICFDRDGRQILVTTEGSNAPVLRYTRK